MRELGVHGLAGLATLNHGILGKGSGDRGEGVRAGRGHVCRVDGREAAPGARAALRRAHGGSAVLGREWRAGVRLRHEVFSRGTLLDQLQMHMVGNDGAYRIRTACFDVLMAI